VRFGFHEIGFESNISLMYLDLFSKVNNQAYWGLDQEETERYFFAIQSSLTQSERKKPHWEKEREGFGFTIREGRKKTIKLKTNHFC
jgi:hypothetical protein